MTDSEVTNGLHTAPMEEDSPDAATPKQTSPSPGRIASLTSRIVSFVSSPLRRSAPPAEETLIDEEITLRGRRRSSGGLVGANLEALQTHSCSSERFFTPQASDEQVSHGRVETKNISKESMPQMSRSFSHVDGGGRQSMMREFDPIGLVPFDSPPRPLAPDAGAPEQKSTLAMSNLLDIEPLCPLTPGSQPKYTERDMTRLKSMLEERAAHQFELLQTEITILQEKYTTALRADEELRELLSEYERTMAQIVEIRRENVDSMSSMEQLLQEKRQLMVDLQAMHIAFANLKQRYEENKTINEQLRLHEQGLKANIAALQTDLTASDRRYEALRTHAEAKMSEANAELHRLKTTLDAELSATRAKLHKAELRAASLDSMVQAKTRENAELMAICDELIQKIDAQAAGTSSTLLASLNIHRPQ